jgi:DNA-binding HxlR family transcriptional regulator
LAIETARGPAIGRDECNVREVLDRVGDKWSLLVIYLLGDGTRRFMDLLRSIDGISQRMLTVTLRGLERDGLVTRTVHPVVPPRVEYRLTPLGHTLMESVGPLMQWSLAHTADIAAARAAYDARPELVFEAAAR